MQLKKSILHPVAERVAQYQGVERKSGLLLAYLNWRQWLVLFAMGALVIGIEIRNHAHMWQEHHSGQTILTDPELIWEIFVFGLVIPILGGVFLAHLSRTAVERDKMARNQEVRRALIGKMHKAQDWHELVEVVVTTPDTIAAADRAWLLAQRSSEEEFDQIAHWERLGSVLLPSSAPVSPAICERCVQDTPLKKTRIFTCYLPDSAGSAYGCTRYCLQLSPASIHKAALLFDVPGDRPLDLGQMKVLDDLSNEMSLALDNANLHDLEQGSIGAARDERLRIARDLHDTLGQNVSYLRLKLEQLSTTRLASDGVQFQNDLAGMLAVADEAYDTAARHPGRVCGQRNSVVWRRPSGFTPPRLPNGLDSPYAFIPLDRPERYHRGKVVR